MVGTKKRALFGCRLTPVNSTIAFQYVGYVQAIRQSTSYSGGCINWQTYSFTEDQEAQSMVQVGIG
jgi:hypothetical protein